ncbi:MAG: glycosyltransferase family 4 protein [Bacteroidota bacterium]
MMRFLTLFPDAENVHLTKDVGMIPFVLYRDFGYDATLACYKNGDYQYLATEVKGLKIVYIKKITGNKFLDSLIYLVFNTRKYDILQVYHLERSSTVVLTLFRLLKFNKAITYLKLDFDERILNVTFKSLLGRLHKYLLGKVTCISIENKILQDKLNADNVLGREVVYIPNGFNLTDGQPTVHQVKKLKKFITVGRIGTAQKNNEVLLGAFAVFCDTDNEWTLELIGDIAPQFNAYIEQYFITYPQLKKRVYFSGFIADKSLLAQKYNEAQVFILTSRFEGMPLVYVEAMQAGCCIISSDILAARDITRMGQFGYLFEVGNVDQLFALMLSVTRDIVKLKADQDKVRIYAQQNYSWVVILQCLNEAIRTV